MHEELLDATEGYTTSFADTIRGADLIVPSKFGVPITLGVATVTPEPYAFVFRIS